MIGKTTAIKSSQYPIVDADGKSWLQVVPHGDLVLNTPYKVIPGRYGLASAALASDNTDYWVGVPAAAVDASEVSTCMLQVGGPVAALVTGSISCTVGYALRVHAGAVAAVASVPTGLESEFATSTATAASSTAQAVYLCGHKIKGTS